MIYPPPKDQKKTNKYKAILHHDVFFNTKPWDSRPYASPEGHETTPSEKCQRWSNTWPLGAAMRLTALRQSLKDISMHPTNSGQPKRKEFHVLDPPNPTTPCDKDTAHSIACITNRGNQNGVQYDLNVPRTLTCIFLSPATPYVNASPLSYSDSPHNSSRTLESTETKEGPRHSVQGVRAAVRRHAPSREQHPAPSMTLLPFAHSPLRSYGSEEACDGMKSLCCKIYCCHIDRKSVV